MATINEISHEHGVHPVQVVQWKKAIQEQAKTLFEGKRGPAPVDVHRDPELLYGDIGKLKVEPGWLQARIECGRGKSGGMRMQSIQAWPLMRAFHYIFNREGFTMILKRLSIVVAFGFVSALQGAHAQIVEDISVGKMVEYRQTSPNATAVNPSGNPYGFYAGVFGTDIELLAAPVLSGPMSVPEPFFNGGKLVFNGDAMGAQGGGWRFGWPDGDDAGYTTASQLNAHFNNGSYSFLVAGTSVTLSLAGDLYPNVPILSLTGGNWSDGKYLFDPTKPLTVTSNIFSGYGIHVDDGIDIFANGHAQIFSRASLNPGENFASFTIPANTYIAGQTDEIAVDFLVFTDVKSNSGLPQSFNAASYDIFGSVLITAVPEPSSPFLVFFGLLALAMYRRSTRTARPGARGLASRNA